MVEIGSAQLPTGSVTAVKPLGALALVDGGELDWKIICINADDPLAAQLNDVEDVERVMPGELDAIRDWFRDYKTPDGKPQNKFGYANRTQPRSLALEEVEKTHGFWKALTSGVRANDKGLAF